MPDRDHEFVPQPSLLGHAEPICKYHGYTRSICLRADLHVALMEWRAAVAAQHASAPNLHVWKRGWIRRKRETCYCGAVRIAHQED